MKSSHLFPGPLSLSLSIFEGKKGRKNRSEMARFRLWPALHSYRRCREFMDENSSAAGIFFDGSRLGKGVLWFGQFRVASIGFFFFSALRTHLSRLLIVGR